jgi:hypothetical protein
VIVGDEANLLNEVTQDLYRTKELTTVCRKIDPTPKFWIRTSRLSPVEQEGLDISASDKCRMVESGIALAMYLARSRQAKIEYWNDAFPMT